MNKTKKATEEKVILGHIFTGNPETPFAEAMHIKDGKIHSIGSKNNVLFNAPDLVKTEVKEGLILPGCAEGHAHVSCTIDKLYGLDFAELGSLETYREAIISYLKEHAETRILIGQGYSNGVFPDKGPNCKILDDICAECGVDIPMVFQSEDCHSYWVNSKAMELAGDTKGTGWAREDEMNLYEPIMPKYTVEEYKIAILHYQDLATMYGITMTYEPMLSARHEYELAIQAYTELAQEGKLHIHFRMSYTMYEDEDYEKFIAYVLDLQKKTESEYFKITGIKYFLDGVVEGHTAYLLSDYADTPGERGECLWKQENLQKAFALTQKNGLQIHIHAIGDAAVEEGLKALEAVNQEMDVTQSRHCMTHLQVVQPDQMDRMSALGMIAVLNPYWHYRSQAYYYNLETPYLGEERVSKEYPVKGFFDAGVLCTQGSDFPVTIPPNLWDCVAISVNRCKKDSLVPDHNPSQKITLEQALTMCTINGAKQMFLEDQYGSLENGKSADYLVLNDDPFLIPSNELYHLRVIEYVVKGNCL